MSRSCSAFCGATRAGARWPRFSCRRWRLIGRFAAGWSSAGRFGSAASSFTRRSSGSRRSDEARAFPLRRAGLAWLALSALVGVAACNGCRSSLRPESTHAGRAFLRHAHGPRLCAVELGGRARTVWLHQGPAGRHRPRRGLHGDAIGARRAVRSSSPWDPRCFSTRSWKRRAARRTDGRPKRSARRSADIGLSAWTPGYNDWAGGAPLLATLAKTVEGPLVAANLEGAPGAVKSVVREVGGIKVGIVGVSAPSSAGARPAGIEVKDAGPALGAAVAEARCAGRQDRDWACGAARAERRFGSPSSAPDLVCAGRRQARRCRRSQRRARPHRSWSATCSSCRPRTICKRWVSSTSSFRGTITSSKTRPVLPMPRPCCL